MKKILMGLFIAIVLFCNVNSVLATSTVTIGWDPNSESDLAGYKVYYGDISEDYDNVFNAGNQTSFTIPNLIEGQTYYIAITAYDTSNNESGYSEELMYTVLITDTIAPEIPSTAPYIITTTTTTTTISP